MMQDILHEIPLTVSNIISLIMILISGYALYRAERFRNQERKVRDQESALAEIQKQLSELQLDREQREVAVSGKAEIGANLVPVGSNKRKLRVFNKGHAAGHNIKIDFPNGNDLISESDLRDKFPMEKLDRGQSVDLIATAHLQSPRKIQVQLSWDNDDGTTGSTTTYPTL